MTLTGMHYYETSGKVKFWGGLSKRQTHTVLTMEQIMKTNGHGTVELRTERMILRRYHPEDAPELYKEFGTDTEMYRYSGWNPYATPEMAQDTVRGFIENYNDDHFYGWAMESDDVLLGTIGAYDYKDDRIEVGFSIARAYWGQGYATEALKAVLEYLTDHEGISCVTAWCASENTGSKRTLEKAGMSLVKTEKGGLSVGNRVYDKLTYDYRRRIEADLHTENVHYEKN